MPIITLESGKLSKEQKTKLVEQFTEVAHQATGIPKQAFVVLIHENDRENIGVGGELLADRK